MKFSTGSLALCAQLFLGASMAQQPLDVNGVKLTSYDVADGFVFGFSLPQTASKNEFIGHIAGTGPGYAGISIGGGMLNRLLLVAWPDGDKVRTSFRFAGGYTRPAIYNGTAEIKEIAHSVKGQSFSITYRCIGCLSWDFAGRKGSVEFAPDGVRMGWAASAGAPSTPSDPKSGISFHNRGQGMLNLVPKEVATFA